MTCRNHAVWDVRRGSNIDRYRRFEAPCCHQLLSPLANSYLTLRLHFYEGPSASKDSLIPKFLPITVSFQMPTLRSHISHHLYNAQLQRAAGVSGSTGAGADTDCCDSTAHCTGQSVWLFVGKSCINLTLALSRFVLACRASNVGGCP